MRVVLNAIKEIPHPEEAHGAVSKDAGRSCNPSFANSFTGSEEAYAPVMPVLSG
jgi:hypothetical protein